MNVKIDNSPAKMVLNPIKKHPLTPAVWKKDDTRAFDGLNDYDHAETC